MNKKIIEDIKIGGFWSGLCNAIDSRLWDIKKLLEEATKDNYKMFQDKLKEIEVKINECKELFQELSNLES
jgi:hypothetical protein